MADIQSDTEFYAHISNEARIPVEDAPSLVQGFLKAISEYVGEEAASVLEDVAPRGTRVGKSDPSVRDDGSIEQFLLDTSEEEAVEEGRAADHARVVAQALRARADESQWQRFQASIEEENILALFEFDRGELTDVDQPTAGRRAQSGEA